jgi:uncharacterized membrane protein YhaH (DUF805 family)
MSDTRSKYWGYGLAAGIFALGVGAVRTVENILGDKIPVNERNAADIICGPLVALGLLAAVILLFIDALVTRSITRIATYGLIALSAITAAGWIVAAIIMRLHQ